jgi:hypothetical protein
MLSTSTPNNASVSKLKLLLGALCLGMVTNLTRPVQPAIAATNISLEYGAIQRSLPLSDLQIFVDTGKPAGIIADVVEVADLKPEQARKLLTNPIPITVVSMDRLVNSYVGEVILGQLGQVILPSGGGDPVTALRASLVNGVKKDQFSLLSAIQNYPTDMRVNGQRFLAIYRQIQRDGRHLPDILAGLQGLVSGLLPGLILGPASSAPVSKPSTEVTPLPTPAESPTASPSPANSGTP